MPSPTSRRPVAAPALGNHRERSSLRFFAPCPRGLEAVLAAELTGFGAQELERVDAGVGFVGDWRVCYRSNRESRIASRILWRLGEWDYRSEQDIYQRAE